MKGTTTLGLACKNGAIIAADKRASMGYFIASKDVKKVFNINDTTAMTVAGSVGDAQWLVRLIRAEASHYEIANGKKMSTSAIATLISNILQGSKYYPFLVQLLIVGFDGTTAGIYSLDPVGGLTCESAASTGSGSPMAYGVIDQEYKKEGMVDDNLRVALKALSSAMSRDIATGEGIMLVTITEDGYREYTNDEIDKLHEGIKKHYVNQMI